MRRLLALPLVLLGVLPAAAPAAERYDVQVSRTEFGIPHIQAKDYQSMGYGYGYQMAKDVPCTVADAYVTVNGERSRFFGPEARVSYRGNGSNASNLNSDLFYKAIAESGRIERLVAQPEPLGPRKELKEGVTGYVAGWNARLREVGGADGISDPACKGEPWVRPITEADAYRRFHQLALLASSGVAVDGIGGAQPPTPDNEQGARGAMDARDLAPGVVDERLGGLGSNAVALGREATQTGRGLLYGNPHFPWLGSERFYQSHLTVPGEVDVAGGSLLGVPIVLIGHTKGQAWSHTVSTARRFAIYEHTLVPGNPTQYVVDGQVKQMERQRVTVQAKQDDGTLRDVTRTLYRTERGPVLTGILGLPIFPWTPAKAYSLEDANEENFGRLFNHFLGVNQAQSAAEVDRVLKRFQGIPWVNTIVADKGGNAYYADVGSVPNVPDAQLQRCSVALGLVTNGLQRLPVLDGSRGDCRPATAPDAVAPEILGVSRMPTLTRADYVSNMNDSHWLSNPKQPLEGFDRIIGEERTTRSLRTRLGIRLVEDQLARGRFDLDTLERLGMDNRVFAGELLADELVAFCRASGLVEGAACDALAKWDRKDDLDSKGAVLFRRFGQRLFGAVPLVQPPFPVGPYTTPFDPKDPVGTPRGLNEASPLVGRALVDAVNDVKGAGLPLDADLRQGQTVERNGKLIPIHGGPGETGVFNVITAPWNAKSGYRTVVHGASYVQAVELTDGCPKARTFVTYGQSTDRTSPHFSDQTERYSRKQWVRPPFCARDVERAAGMVRSHTSDRGGTTLRSARWTEGRGRTRPRLDLDLARRAARVTVTVQRGRKVVRRITRRRLDGRRALLPRVPKGKLEVRVQAGRDVVRFTVRQR